MPAPTPQEDAHGPRGILESHGSSVGQRRTLESSGSCLSLEGVIDHIGPGGLGELPEHAKVLSHVAVDFHRLQHQNSVDEAIRATLDEEVCAQLDPNFLDDNYDDRDPMAVALKYYRELQQKQREASSFKREALMIDEEDVAVIIAEYKASVMLKRWVRFDTLFGVFVALNGVMEGIASEGLVKDDNTLMYLASNAFCIIFMIEFGVRWYYTDGGFFKMMQDSWLVFDLTIIILSAIDLWFLQWLDLGTGGAGLAVVRVFRLIRFIRLLRLVKAIKGLWFLAQSWIKAVPILIWACVCIILICYTFGILFYELVGKDQSDAKTDLDWGSIGRSMLSIVQLATYDGAGALMRHVLEGKLHKRYLLALFLPCHALLSLGLFNLMVGTLLCCCFELGNLDQVCDQSITKLIRHKAFQELETWLNDECAHHIGAAPDEPALSYELIAAWLEHEEDEDAGDQPKDATNRRLTDILEDANISLEDVDSIFNEVRTFQGEQHTLIRVHDFVQGCMFIQTEIHDLQITQFIAAQSSMYSRLAILSDVLAATADVMETVVVELAPALIRFQSPRSPRGNPLELREGGDEALEDELREDIEEHEDGLDLPDALQPNIDDHKVKAARHYGVVDGATLEALRKRDRAERYNLAWVKFDLVFLVAVMFNSIMLGVDVSRENEQNRDFVSNPMDGQAYLWMFLEFLFFAVFWLEFVLRCCLIYQIQATESCTVHMIVVPTTLLDTSPVVQITRAFRHVPQYLQDDIYLCFDLVLLLFAVTDNFVLRFFFRDLKYISLLKMFRALRLLRVARILYLFHDLIALLLTISTSWVVVVWNLVLVAGALYITAIFFQTFMHSCIPKSDPIYNSWYYLAESYYSQWKLATFRGWGDTGRALDTHCGEGAYFAVLAVTLFCGMGILNVGTGIVIQQSFRYAMQEEESLRTSAGGRVKKAGYDRLRHIYKQMQYIYDRDRMKGKEDSRTRTRNFFTAWKMLIVTAKEEARNQQKAAAPQAHLPSPKSLQPSPVPPHPAPPQTEAPALDLQMQGRTLSRESQGTQQEVADSILEQWCEVRPMPRQPATNVVSAHSLMKLLEDEHFLQRLASDKVRPDQVIMLFQRLDVLKYGSIDLDDFIEGLQRLLYTIDGLDVANTKSTARRLYLDSLVMTQHASQLHEVFLDATCALRGITPVGHVKTMDDWDGTEEHVDDSELFLQAQKKVLDEENHCLRLKIEKVKRQMDNMLHTLEKLGDNLHGSPRGREFRQDLAVGGNDKDDDSIHSADLGKD